MVSGHFPNLQGLASASTNLPIHLRQTWTMSVYSLVRCVLRSWRKRVSRPGPVRGEICMSEIILASYEPNLIADSGITFTTFNPLPVRLISSRYSKIRQGKLTGVQTAHAASVPELFHGGSKRSPGVEHGSDDVAMFRRDDSLLCHAGLGNEVDF